ncbi:MAG TPA: NADH-quinone oxidoreductase subunit M [Vicinamibacterales bacterium]|nr:NADH-quinone oxidoreductase subunit M [Vicinamibacterales bacterium]
MILVAVIAILLIAGLLAWISSRWSTELPRWISLTAAVVGLILTGGIWFAGASPGPEGWLEEVKWSWIPAFGIHIHLAMDGLSFLMVMLTLFLGIMAVLASWTEIRERVGFFHFNLMWVLAGIAGVFLALDLFLFYFAWELMLIPMYFLIILWGHERRIYAGMKFFLFTQLSGLLMLIAILALYFAHYQATGVLTFDYSDLLRTTLTPVTEMWIMLGFFIAFAVKLPVVPLHTWLPDAHTEAPTAGSVILAGLLLKTGAYGLMRFVVPLFPGAAHAFAPVALVLAVIGIVYGAVMAFSQTDLKRLVAYTSVSHLGFVLLGIFAWNPLALQGAVMTMICHGLSTGGLFIIVGGLQERIHTRDLGRMGGLWAVAPRLSAVALVFGLASLGLPGLGDFVGEFLVLLGAYQVSVSITVIASLGVLASTFYALRMVQRAFQGPNTGGWRLTDLTAREGVMMAVMIAGLLWLGFYPRPVLDTFTPAMRTLQQHAQASIAALGDAQ